MFKNESCIISDCLIETKLIDSEKNGYKSKEFYSYRKYTPFLKFKKTKLTDIGIIISSWHLEYIIVTDIPCCVPAVYNPRVNYFYKNISGKECFVKETISDDFEQHVILFSNLSNNWLKYNIKDIPEKFLKISYYKELFPKYKSIIPNESYVTVQGPNLRKLPIDLKKYRNYIKLYCAVQLYRKISCKNKKAPFYNSWNKSSILEPKLTGCIMSYY